MSVDYGERQAPPPPPPRSALERIRERLVEVRREFEEEFDRMPVAIGPDGKPRFAEEES
jgi:hypothetical protein